MQYFLDSQNQIWAYEDYVPKEEIKEGIKHITNEEFQRSNTHTQQSAEEILELAQKEKLAAIREKRESVIGGRIG